MDTRSVDPAQLLAILAIGHDASMRGVGRSLRDLLADTEYRRLRPNLTESTIAAALRAHPEVIEQWLLYSDDKRTSGGWGFSKQARQWTVGRRQPPVSDQFDAGDAACAVFIIRELDFWSEVEEVPPPLIAGRFRVDKFLPATQPLSLLLAGYVTEGAVLPGMTLSVLLDSALYMSVAIEAVDTSIEGNSESLKVLTLAPEDEECRDFFSEMVGPGDTLILGK